MGRTPGTAYRSHEREATRVGGPFEIPGVRTITTPSTDYRRPRIAPVQLIVLHSTGEHGTQTVVPGSRPVTNQLAWSDANLRAGAERRASWDATLIGDGTLLWHSDPVRFESYHASGMNPRSLGIEIAQGPNGEINQTQIDAMVLILDFLTAYFGVQREIPWYHGAPDRRVMPRFSLLGGQDYVGIVGHRNGDSNKSDPGDGIFRALHAAGYEGFDLSANEDRRVWEQRQAAVGAPVDGVPGPVSRAAFARAGHAGGVWVARGGSNAALVGVGLLAAGAAAWWLWRRRGRMAA